MKDPYRILGVSRTASEADVKKAYRTLAKKYHPDKNPDDPSALERFKDISAAYSLIGDPESRRGYDRGELDAAGAERAYTRQSQGRARGFGGFEGFGGGAGGYQAEDLFSDFFGNIRRQQARAEQKEAEDKSYEAEISFLDAAKGTTVRITLDWGKTLEVKIPAGVRDGQQIRLKGQAGRSTPIAKAGDALITVSVRPHDFFTRKENDIHLDAPVSLREALLGAKITVPTIHGAVSVTVPGNSSSGTLLRLKEKGIHPASGGPAGDQYVRLHIVLPEKPDPALEKLVNAWPADAEKDIRRHLRT